MLGENTEELQKFGASITAKEIKQQPRLWKDTYDNYSENRDEINNYLNSIASKFDKIRIIFTGAGTSAYIGNTVAPYLKEKLDGKKWEIESIPTTSIVSNPYQYLQKDIPTLLVSFARSGNSPESVAAVRLAKQLVDNLYQMTITCASDGELANKTLDDEQNYLLLMPEESNDKGFAMTGAFTCMTLATLLVFDTFSEKEQINNVKTIIKLGNSVLERDQDIKKIINSDFERIIYLGSGSLEGLAREAQLKVLELTAGETVTAFDSSLGFRHGPKSFVDESTLVFLFVSNKHYTRLYDIDMLNELRADGIAKGVWALQEEGQENFEGDTFLLSNKGNSLPDAYLALPYIVFAQIVSLFAAIKLGNKPDTPSPTGTVNRVVKGVTIHEYK